MPVQILFSILEMHLTGSDCLNVISDSFDCFSGICMLFEIGSPPQICQVENFGKEFRWTKIIMERGFENPSIKKEIHDILGSTVRINYRTLFFHLVQNTLVFPYLFRSSDFRKNPRMQKFAMKCQKIAGC